jgi:hypothetical protein
MENISELLHQVFAVLVFCAAVFLLFMEFRNYESVLLHTKFIFEEKIVYEQDNESEERPIKKGEIIASLFLQQEHDMEINGYLISKTQNTKDLLLSYNIPNTDYVKSYAYDNSGTITRIIYSSDTK